MADVHGFCAPGYEAVRDALGAILTSGPGGGASVAVTVDGAAVVDLWGGTADAAGTRAWERDTIANTWSTTKTVTNLGALVLVDRGELELEAPVARYWPEFAAAGKGEVQVGHVLSHAAGLPSWDEKLLAEDLADREKCTVLLAAQEPWWTPGRESGYHALTQGFLVGELVRRVTGTSVGAFLAETLTGPLDADFTLGTAADAGRAVSMIPPTAPRPVTVIPGSITARVLGNPAYPYTVTDEPWWRGAEIPAANGFGNARSVARVGSVLACGGTVDGHEILSEKGCERAFVPWCTGTDLVIGVPVRFGPGWALVHPGGLTQQAGPRSCFWGGAGGSLSLVDPDARMAFAFVMSAMQPAIAGDARSASLLAATYAALGGIPGGPR